MKEATLVLSATVYNPLVGSIALNSNRGEKSTKVKEMIERLASGDVD